MKTVFNSLLIDRLDARYKKQAFVDTAAASGAGGAAGGDPMAAAGAPPGAMMGGDPAAAAGGGAPPAPAPESGGVMDPAAIQTMVQQAVQQAMGSQGGAGGAMGPNGQPKKKVDVNTEIYQIKKLLVQLLSSMGQQVDPSLLLGDPADDPHAPPEQAASDPASSGAAPQSAIMPIQGIGGASPALAQQAQAAAPAGGQQKQSDMREIVRQAEVLQAFFGQVE